jgi:hypothetical protein
MIESKVRGRARQDGNVARNLTTHSTGARVNLAFIVNLSVPALNARPVNSSVGSPRVEAIGRRKKIPADIVADITSASRRRCCLCFALDQDAKEKQCKSRISITTLLGLHNGANMSRLAFAPEEKSDPIHVLKYWR